jgi:NADPH:quinone reductase-like Zn-dependent oxidoreductase
MRRVRYKVNGGLEVLFAEDVPIPEPGLGELLVRAEAVGVTLPAVRCVLACSPRSRSRGPRVPTRSSSPAATSARSS